MIAVITRWRQAGLLWPTALSLVGLAFLIGLGNWQMARKAWKEGLLRQIATRVHAPPVPLSDVLRSWHDGGDLEYTHVRLSGRFAHGAERHVFAVDEKLGPGFHVYTPLVTADRKLVFVNRGFVPGSLVGAASRPAGEVAGETTLSGLVRRPMPRGSFVPVSDLAHNMFYWPDYAGMTASIGNSVGSGLDPVPFFVDADADPANPGGSPRGGVTQLVLPNRHLEYVITWYGLAVTLVCVFAAFARSRLRHPG